MATFIQSFLALALLATVVLAKPASKVVGGVDAEKHEFPYQISLQYGGQHFCGGSLIADQYVLTAGHCAVYDPVEAVAGAHDFRYQDTEVQRRNVVKVWVHEGYGQGVGPNDLAVFRLDKPFKLNEFVGLVSLPKQNVVHEGVCVISGWGSTSFGAAPSYPDVLQKAYLPLMEQKQCEEIWHDGPIEDSNVCAGTVEGSSSVCSGDSGGPLVKEAEGRREQVGIVSWGGIPCGGYNNPGVFVRVSYFVDWIQDKLAKEQ